MEFGRVGKEKKASESQRVVGVAGVGVGVSGRKARLSTTDSASSDNEVFVSVKSINISGSDSDLPKLLLRESSVRAEGGEKFNIPDIKSETRVVVPRVCSDSHIGEGEGFHSSRLSSSALNHASPGLLAVGITQAKNAAAAVKGICGTKNELEKVRQEFSESLNFGNRESREGKTLFGDEPTANVDLGGAAAAATSVEAVGRSPSIEDFLDEELLAEYDEPHAPPDELHAELEKIFDSEFNPEIEVERRGRGPSGRSGGGRIKKNKISKLVDSSTWTQEDDMPSPLSDLSPVESPKKNRARGGKSSSSKESGAAASAARLHQPDHQFQYKGGYSKRRSKGSSNSSNRGLHLHQSNQNQREIIFHHPQPNPECYTVSSQLLSREARLYENVPPHPKDLGEQGGQQQSLEIFLSGEGHHPSATSPSAAYYAHPLPHQGYRGNNGNSKNNGSSGGSGGSGGGQHHSHSQHFLSSNNLNLAQGSSAEQLFSVSELLGGGGGVGGGSCLAMGGGGGPPSRTSWVDSGRESLSFDGENNNSGGSCRNLLLIPPPPPPPINYHQVGGGGHFANVTKLHSSASPAHSASAASGRRTASKRDRLVRQKQAIDDPTFLPIPTNSMDKLGMDQGGMGSGGYLAVPSPSRRGIQNGIIASNFMAAASSPISLQRHPPTCQINLHENKKSKALIACDSPYGMLGGAGGDWGGFGGTGDKKGGGGGVGGIFGRVELRRGVRSPGRSRLKGKGGGQSFDYGELPSHQMLPKRLYPGRQVSNHHHHQPGGGFPGGRGSGNNHMNGCPQNQHRSFPANAIR